MATHADEDPALEPVQFARRPEPHAEPQAERHAEARRQSQPPAREPPDVEEPPQREERAMRARPQRDRNRSSATSSTNAAAGTSSH